MTNKKLKSTQATALPTTHIGEITVTLKELTTALGFDEETVLKGIAELEASGLVKRVATDKYILMSL